MATKRQRGAAWHYTIRRRGLLPKPIYLSFPDEREGDDYVAKLEALLERGIVPEEFQQAAPIVTLADLVTEYLGTYAVSAADRAILDAEKTRLTTRAKEIDFAWAEALVRDLKEQLLAPGTIRHRVGALARCLDWAARRGTIDANPLRLLPRGYATYADGAVTDTVRERRLEPGEEASIRRVLAGEHVADDKQRPLAIPQRDALLVMLDLALETAMRMSEIYTLDKRQVDLPKRTVFLDRTKNGDRRQVPLSSVAVAVLEPIVDGDGLLLPFYCGDRPKTTSRLSRQWGRVFTHAGCGDLNFHDLRHEATCRFFERTTMTDTQISLITGHRDPRMLRRYANLRASDLSMRLW